MFTGKSVYNNKNNFQKEGNNGDVKIVMNIQ